MEIISSALRNSDSELRRLLMLQKATVFNCLWWNDMLYTFYIYSILIKIRGGTEKYSVCNEYHILCKQNALILLLLFIYL